MSNTHAEAAVQAVTSSLLEAKQQAAAPHIRVAHAWEPARPEVRVKLIRNTKGYQWEISYEGPDLVQVLVTLRQADAELREQYGEPVE